MSATHARHSGATVAAPAYNEEARVASVVAELRGHFDTVVVVDDGRDDETAARGRAAGDRPPRPPGNLAQAAALQTGFAFARTDPAMQHVITFDSDGQPRVQDAVALLAVA